jgi:Cu-Zn family superoxide dismutase
MFLRIALSAASFAALTACSGERQEPPPANEAEANAVEPSATPQTIGLIGTDGRPVGTVTLSEDASGVTVQVDASAIPAGTHGLHLHEKGLCDGPTFASAGAHWNPQSKQHGRDNPLGVHLGDLDNLVVPEAGTASARLTIAAVTIQGAANALADADGTSLVVHARPDDYKTDPSGNSGDRIACAVLAPPAS